MSIIYGQGDNVDQTVENEIPALGDNLAEAHSSFSAITLHAYPEPALEESWRRYILSEQYPTHYLAPEFFLEPFFADKNPFAILLMKGDDVVAVLTGIHEKTYVRCGNSASPQLSISAECIPKGLARLMRALRRETSTRKGSTVASFANVPDLEKHGFFQRTAGGTMMLDLRQGPEAIYKKFSKGRRSDIQFAIKSGVEIFEASSEIDFEHYYKLHCDWCARKNLSQHPRDVILRALQVRSNRRLFLAGHNGKIIAGTIIRFLDNGIAEYAANNSLEEYQSLRPNPLLNWAAIQWAFKRGLKTFSMGGSHQYLRYFGGQEIPIYRYSADASLFKMFQLREWLIKKRQAFKNSRQANHD